MRGSNPPLPQGLHVGNAPAKALRSTTTQVCVYLINESRVKSVAHPHRSAISYFLVKWLGGSGWIPPWLRCQTITLPVQTSCRKQSRAALLNRWHVWRNRGDSVFCFDRWLLPITLALWWVSFEIIVVFRYDFPKLVLRLWAYTLYGDVLCLNS